MLHGRERAGEIRRRRSAGELPALQYTAGTEFQVTELVYRRIGSRLKKVFYSGDLNFIAVHFVKKITNTSFRRFLMSAYNLAAQNWIGFTLQWQTAVQYTFSIQTIWARFDVVRTTDRYIRN